MAYTQLTQEQRYQIHALLKMEHSQTVIAEVIGTHRSTISREMKRNRGKRGYRPQQAHQFALDRRKKTKLTIKAETWAMVEENLLEDWSPEQITGKLKEIDISISHEHIYQYVYADKRAGGELWTHLRCQKKRRKRAGGRDRRGQIPGRVSIEQRPAVVEERTRLGDWEGDTIVGHGHKGALLTLVDRKSGYTLIGRLTKREAQQVVDRSAELLSRMPYVETLTVDNGKEFAGHAKIKDQTGADVYFAHPYASWERGTNENTNGLIRQYLPKKRRLDDVEEHQVVEIMRKLNHRPRKRLDFKTPHEVFFGQSVAVTT